MDYESYFKGIMTNIASTGFPVTHPEPIFEEKMLPARDGVKLATDIFFPAKEGSFPTIVQRGCYAEQEPLNNLIGKEFAKRGFAYVCQYCRGIGRSEGVWEPKVNERRDGKDLVDWLQNQDWVASMGYYGSSYLAMTGWAIADIVPSKMKTMFLSNYGVHDYLANYHDGILKPDITTGWAMDNAGWKITADYLTSAKYRPAMTADTDLWGGELPWYRDVLKSTTENSHYWTGEASKNLRAVAPKIKIPLFISEGWYDHHLENALTTYHELSENVRAHSRLEIGGWNHFGQPAIFGRDVPNLLKNDFKTMLQWFQNLLVDGVEPIGKIETYEINADSWHTLTSLDDAENSQKFYFSSDRTLTDDLSSVQLGQVGYTYNPETPVPSVGGEVLLHTADQIGSRPQPTTNYRDDVLSFVSQPLKTSQHLFGKIQLKLSLSTDADDTAFVAKVCEVNADGQTFNIRTTIATVASQFPNYKAGDTVDLTLTMLPIDWQLSTGSRIRVDLTSSDFPQYQLQSNYRGNQSEQAESRLAHQQMVLSADQPSYLKLPVAHA